MHLTPRVRQSWAASATAVQPRAISRFDHGVLDVLTIDQEARARTPVVAMVSSDGLGRAAARNSDELELGGRRDQLLEILGRERAER